MLKKTLTLLFAAATLCAAAQERTVNRLPEIGRPTEDVEYSSNNSGFWAAVELSGGTTCRINKNNTWFGEADVVAGYRFNDFIRVGAGFGSRYYGKSDSPVRYSSIDWSFPVYLDLRGNFIPQTYRNVVPYWSFDVGATLRDGFMMRPSAGIRVGRQRCAFLLALSYTGQNMKVSRFNALNREVGSNRFVSLVSLRLGYEF